MKRLSLLGFIALLFCFSLNPAVFAENTTPAEEEQPSLPEIKKAAKAGDPDAQYALGYMYYYGRGVNQNLSLAKQWIKKAAAQGQEQAMQAEKILLGNITTESPKTSSKKTHQKINTKTTEPELVEKKAKKTPRKTAVKPKPKKSVVKERSVYSQPQTKPTETTSSSSLQIKEAKGHYFSVQLSASSNQHNAMEFIKKLSFQPVHYYKRTRDGKNEYVVIYGKFTSPQEANAAIHELPESIQKLQPWVKSYSMIRKEIHPS
jgi:DamX protein